MDALLMWVSRQSSNTMRLQSPLGAFAQLRKETTSFVMPVFLSVLIEQFGSHWRGFVEIWYLTFFSKICRGNSSSIKI